MQKYYNDGNQVNLFAIDKNNATISYCLFLLVNKLYNTRVIFVGYGLNYLQHYNYFLAKHILQYFVPSKEVLE